MLTGKRCGLTWDTLAIESINEKRIAVTVPTGEIIEVISMPDDTRMVDVRWDGRLLHMFAEDVKGATMRIWTATHLAFTTARMYRVGR